MTKGIFIKLLLPDYLSLFRIPAAIVLVFLAIYDFRQAFAWLLLIALVTDALDGYIARKRKNTTKHGALLDSIGDASLFLGAYTGIIILETVFFEKHLPIFLPAVVLYFFQLGLGLWRYGRPSSFHTYSAKTAALVHAVFLTTTGFFDSWNWLFYTAIVISILEAVEEIWLIFLLKDPVANVKGIYWVMKNGKDPFK